MDQSSREIAVDLEDIGEAVKRARVEKHLTQDDLAQRAGVGRSLVATLETGRAPDIGFVRLNRILQVVGLDFKLGTYNAGRPTLDDLMSEQEDAENAPGLGRR